MNELSILLSFIIDTFKSNSLVNTVSMVSNYEIDTNKENIYMLVNFDLTETEVLSDVVLCYFDITAVQQRDITNTAEDSKLLIDSNFIDNLNETHSVLQRFINYLEQQNNIYNIELASKTRLKPIKNKPLNGLDGFRFSCSLSIPNKGASC